MSFIRPGICLGSNDMNSLHALSEILDKSNDVPLVDVPQLRRVCGNGKYSFVCRRAFHHTGRHPSLPLMASSKDVEV